MCSLFNNGMGAEGTAALAKMLPGTQIQTLKCAAAERERPSQRAGDTEVRVFMEVRMPAATPGASH